MQIEGGNEEQNRRGCPPALDRPPSGGILSVGAPLAPARLLFRRFAAPRARPPELAFRVWRSVMVPHRVTLKSNRPARHRRLGPVRPGTCVACPKGGGAHG